MPLFRKIQFISIVLAIVGCFGMGMCLFALDGITHPTHLFTFFAILFGIGLVGNLIGAFWRLAEEERNKENRMNPDK